MGGGPQVKESLLTRAPVCRTEPPEGYSWTPPPFHFVLAFCNRDEGMAVTLLDWIADLGPVDRELTLFVDKGTNTDLVMRSAVRAFREVHVQQIPKSGAPWPGCNNFVWYHTCRIMAAQNNPWLLLETDMAPCAQDWVQRLENEYTRARKPFLGAWVEPYDIMNGGGVYPPDVHPWCPEFFKKNPLTARAYDCEIAPEIVWFTHNASHLMPNVWFTRGNGRPGGQEPRIPVWDKRLMEWVCNHNAVLVHRCKDATLIKLLRERFDEAARAASLVSYGENSVNKQNT
jgi:hypothetical protein